MSKEKFQSSSEILKFHQITQGAYIVGVIGHINATLLFWYLEVSELVYFNIFFSVPAFAIALYLNSTKHENFAFSIACIELLFHQVASTYYLGWDFGAHFWLIYLAGLCFFNPNWHRFFQYGLLFIICFVYVTISYVFHDGVYTLSENMSHISYITNAISTILITSLLINYYSNTTKKLEQNLLEEQKVIENLLNKIKSLFGQQISHKIAKHIIENEEGIKTTNFHASIMFLDIRDFTVFADSKPPSEVAKFQNIVFGEVIKIISENHGVVLQLLGDGLMAVFGAPIRYKEHEKNAVNSGFGILKCIDNMIKAEKIPPIRIGIGLHAGNIVAGNIGNQERQSYSLTGRNVIISARIESLNKDFNSQFLVSESIFQKMNHDEIKGEDLGEVKLKGFGEPTRVYKLA
ncbi:adenylate/guanylate cyclase domain-containing protein [Flammeovirga sp. EKP202]|uniref:adenylate/guanylate cyclase domain-containing protein n=1 Tax=Flammeovirga sp. EKP202 TaxID=2770592 RepID=UPI00165FAFAA|nr:adenylate/guanylate cyclase domain-containing protein [Flammeovirga sp. EKP202]MBD0401416.1 adenylate/guanylate cyclase domain-containing protein [Flammeovirga sp. EKP202]